jgi:hypothetical protein
MDFDAEQVKRMESWLQRSRIDYFQLYVNLWVGFNYWFAKESNEPNRDRNGIEWVKNNLRLKNLYESDLLVPEKIFKKTQAYLDTNPMQPSNRYDWHGKFSEERQWSELVEFLYQVRCNLFHGRKNPDDYTDNVLVEMAYGLLIQIYSFFILDIQGITTGTALGEWKVLQDKSDKLMSDFYVEASKTDVDSKTKAAAIMSEWRANEEKRKNHVHKYVRSRWIDG